MTDVRHITHDPREAALRAQLDRVETALDGVRDLLIMFLSEVPHDASKGSSRVNEILRGEG